MAWKLSGNHEKWGNLLHPAVKMKQVKTCWDENEKKNMFFGGLRFDPFSFKNLGAERIVGFDLSLERCSQAWLATDTTNQESLIWIRKCWDTYPYLHHHSSDVATWGRCDLSRSRQPKPLLVVHQSVPWCLRSGLLWRSYLRLKWIEIGGYYGKILL